MADPTAASARLKIALISDWYLPRFGGLELHLQDLARELTAEGHDVHIVTGVPGPSVDGGVPVHRIQAPLAPGSGFVYTPGAVKQIRMILREHAFDVAHCHVSVVSPTSCAAAYVCRTLGIPAVVTFHSFLGFLGPVLSVLDIVLGWSQWPFVLSAVSGAVARQVKRLTPRREISLLPNGVNASDWRNTPEPREPGVIHVVSVMRLKGKKRARALVRILRDVRRRLAGDPMLRATIIGDGPKRRLVRRLVNRYGLRDVVTLAGHQDRSVIRDVFARSDIFVSPTIEESFGIAALEARSAGLPVVAMLQAGVSEFIHHGEEGLLARSDREMVDHVVTLATDDGLRSAIARHNVETPGPATNWRQVTAQHLVLYRKARELVPAPAPVHPQEAAVQASSISPASLRD